MNNIERIFIGQIVVKNKVDFTDPCYDKDVWCRRTVSGFKPGKYNCFIEVADFEEWGKRNTRCLMFHESVCEEDVDSLECLLVHPAENGVLTGDVFDIGVDAGLAGMFVDKPDFADDKWQEFCDMVFACENDSKLPTTAMVCKLNENNADNDAFFCSSGYGDGVYDAYLYKDESGKNIGATILFID